jgi:hypothetical protein
MRLTNLLVFMDDPRQSAIEEADAGQKSGPGKARA